MACSPLPPEHLYAKVELSELDFETTAELADLVRDKPRRLGRGRIARTAEPSFGFISVRSARCYN
jgi:hypothetical protein